MVFHHLCRIRNVVVKPLWRLTLGLENDIWPKHCAICADGGKDGDCFLCTSTLLILNSLSLSSNDTMHLGKLRWRLCLIHAIHVFRLDPSIHNLTFDNVFPFLDVYWVDGAGTVSGEMSGPVRMNLILVSIDKPVDPVLPNAVIGPCQSLEDFVRKLFHTVMCKGEAATTMVNCCMDEGVFLLRGEFLSALTELRLCDMAIFQITRKSCSVNLIILSKLS